MPGFNPAMIGAPSPVGRGGGSGSKLVERRWFRAAGTVQDTVPTGATRATIRGLGPGAHAAGDGDFGGGGGGAYARDDASVAPGQSITVTVGPAGSSGGETSVTIGSKTVVRAAGGLINSNGGAGGQASACVGAVRRSGGSGKGYSSNEIGGTGESGGAGTPRVGAGYGGAGGSAGDIGDFDSLNIGYSPIPVGRNTYGTGGSGGNNNPTATGGLVVIEYWSA